MIRFRKTVAVVLLFIILLSLSGNCLAVFDKTELSGGLFQIIVVHTLKMDSLNDNIYTVWTSAMCFAAGSGEDGTVYLATDASLMKPDRVYAQLGDLLIEYLNEGGIFIENSDLPNYAVITATLYYIIDDGVNIPLTPVNQNSSDKLLILTLADSSYDLSPTAATYAYADTLKTDDTVYTFALSGEIIDGAVSATQDAVVTNWSLATKEGKVTFAASLTDGNNALTYYDLPASRAAQGSPLYNSDGCVVGINIWSDAYEGTVALTSAAIMTVLDKLGAVYNIFEISTGDLSLDDILLYIIILAAAVVVLIILLLILRIRKKKLDTDDVSDLEREASRARESIAAKTQPSPQIKPAQTGRASAYSVVIPPVASAPSVPQKTPVNAAKVPSRVTLAARSGRMSGITLEVAERVVMGRDPGECAVVFPADATEISRRHCAVSYNSQTGRVLLEDFSSSNGTYFPSGTRIIPERLYSMRDGDRFYLGLPDNLFEIRIEYAESGN